MVKKRATHPAENNQTKWFPSENFLALFRQILVLIFWPGNIVEHLTKRPKQS